jgi:hypothetical protein
MNDIVVSIWKATQAQFNFKMLILVFAPFMFSVVCWSVITFIYWNDWHQSLILWINGSSPPQWLSQGVVSIATGYFISVMILFLLAPAVYLTTILITAFFSMPIIVEHVQIRDFPQITKRGNSNIVLSIVNTLIALSVLILGWLVSFPLWLLTPLSPLISILLTAYMIQRLFRFDALSLYATREELRIITQRSFYKFMMLGIIAGVMQFIPFINLFIATWVGLAFTYLALEELRQLRYSEAYTIN